MKKFIYFHLLFHISPRTIGWQLQFEQNHKKEQLPTHKTFLMAGQWETYDRKSTKNSEKKKNNTNGTTRHEEQETFHNFC